MKKLTCADARQIDLVDYLASIDHHPQKIKNQDYWYLSPFRQEHTPSFKINRSKNLWFDFGEGKGGDIIDFGVKYFKCPVSELLEKLSQQPLTRNFSFHPQPLSSNKNLHPPYTHPPAAGEKKKPGGGHIYILDERRLAAKPLLEYLKKRCIPVAIAEQFCKEVDFKLYGKKYTAIGFKNNSGGYELRNGYFKASSSPKDITFFENSHPGVAVFEGFFDFLSWQVLQKENTAGNTNFLILNSLSFFNKAKEVMDKHQQVHLYLDHNKQGIKCTSQALQWDNKKYKDQSKFYRGEQDLNDWLISQAELKTDLLPKNERLSYRKGLGI